MINTETPTKFQSQLLALILFGLFSLSYPFISYAQSIPVWVDLEVQGNTVYLLRKSPAQIMRYDLSTSQWKVPISLPKIPTAFSVDSTHIYVAYGREIKQLDKSGGNELHVTNTADDVNEMLMDGNLLFANRTSDLYARLTVINKSSLSVIVEWENYIDSLYGASIAPSRNKLFGRSQGISPSDITFADYDDAGNILQGGDSPYHGAYPGALETWVFPDDNKVVDSSGTVYNTSDLSYNNSFATNITDIDFSGIDIPIVLVDDQLISFSNTLLETGRHTLDNLAQNLVVYGSNIFVFYEDAGTVTETSVEIVSLAELSPNTPGLPIDPQGLEYDIDSITIDGAGVVYVLSKNFASIFRWDTTSQSYLDTISLPEPADIIEYSADLDRLYVYSASRRIYQVDLVPAIPTVMPFVNVPLSINKMIPLGSDLFVLANGSWDDQWIYDQHGTLLITPVQCCYDVYHFYDAPTTRLYFENRYKEYLGSGTFGPVSGSGPYNLTPLAISRNSQLLIDAGGFLYSADDLTAIDVLSNDILAAGWDINNQLFTVEDPGFYGSTITSIQKWNQYLVDTLELVVSGEYQAFFVMDEKVLLVTSVDGIPKFNLLDTSFLVVAPPALDVPELSITKFSAIAVYLEWMDVQGEREYILERRLLDGPGWQTVTVAPTGSTSFVDSTVVTGNIYQYRIKAKNGELESAYSEIVELDLTGVDDPRINPATITFIPDDAFVSQNDVVYLLSQQHQSIFTWDVKNQYWGTTIPLEGSPQYFAYSAMSNAIFTLYADGRISSINLAAGTPVEIPFTELPVGQVCGIAAAGEYLISCEGITNWDNLRSFDSVGNMVDVEDYRYPIAKGVWSQANQKIYHFRDGTSPNDLIATEVFSDGSIGVDQDSPYHSSTGINYPIRVKPDGSIVVLGSGRIYDAISLEYIDDLPTPVDDVTWLDGSLISVTGNAISLNVEPDYTAELKLTLTEEVYRIFPVNQKRVVVVVITADDNTNFFVYDESFDLISPAIFTNGFE